MALFGPQFVQALSTAMGGQQQAANLFQQNQQIQNNANILKQQGYEQTAGQDWSKALMEVLKSQQTAPTSPLVPPPAQAGTPSMSAGAPGAGTGAAQAGTPPAATAAAAPAQPIQTAQPQPVSQQSAMQGIQGLIAKIASGQPITPQDIQALNATAPQPTVGQPGQPFSPMAILDQVQKDNPNLDPGVMSAIVENHLMPMMSDQQKFGLEQAKSVLEMEKMTSEQKDKMYELLFKVQEAQIKQNDFSLSLADRQAARAEADSFKQAMLAIAGDRLSLEQQNTASEIAARDAAAAKSKAQTAALTNAAATGGKKFEEANAQIDQLKNEANDLFHYMHDHPKAIGALRDAYKAGQTVTAFLGGRDDPTVRTMDEKIAALKEHLNAFGALYKGQFSSTHYENLGDEIQGTGFWDTVDSSRTSVADVWKTLDYLQKHFPHAQAASPNDTQLDPKTNQPLSETKPDTPPPKSRTRTQRQTTQPAEEPKTDSGIPFSQIDMSNVGQFFSKQELIDASSGPGARITWEQAQKYIYLHPDLP